MKKIVFFMFLLIGTITVYAQNFAYGLNELSYSADGNVSGIAKVVLFRDTILVDILTYEITIYNSSYMKFGLLSRPLVKLPKRWERGEYRSEKGRYVLEAFKREIVNATGADGAELNFRAY